MEMTHLKKDTVIIPSGIPVRIPYSAGSTVSNNTTCIEMAIDNSNKKKETCFAIFI